MIKAQMELKKAIAENILANYEKDMKAEE